MHRQVEAVEKLQEVTMHLLKDRHKKSLYYWGRVQNIVKGLMIWAVLIMMITATAYIETNIINWVFLTLNLVNFGLIIRGNKSLKSLKTN